MLSVKKTAITVLILSSGAAFAGSMGPTCTTGSVTVPCEHSAWDFGVQALYLNPNYSIGQFTQNANETSSPNNLNISNHSANAIWDWGFKLEGSYHFRSGNDFNLNWYHYNHSTNQTLTSGTAPLSFIYDTLANVNIYSNVASHSKTQWDAVNLELGQHVDFGQWKKIRFHGGLQYANIQTTSSNTATSASTATAAASDFDIANSSNTLKYSGFGPRIGADLSYDWNNGLAIYAKGASALLVGSRSSNSSITGTVSTYGVTVDGFPAGPFSVIESGPVTAIVPELEAKAGATYTYSMAQGDLSLDIGWMWANYFNAQATLNDSDAFDFGVQGPYIGLKWVGNIA